MSLMSQLVYKITKLMIKAAFRFATLLPKASLRLQSTRLPLGTIRPIFSFSDKHDHKHGEHCNHNHEGHKQHKREHEQKEQQKKGHHEHGPNCKHDHGHHHESHHEPHHQHGPNCNHNHPHDHHAAHPSPKLSKLTFEELIQLNTEEALRYANSIYEQENKKLKELQEEKEMQLKNIEFYKKLEGQVKEKERKLEENIKIYQEEAALSNKRAEKQVEESKTFAVTKIAKELLEVADCIAKCKKLAEEAEQKDKYVELMVQAQKLVHDVLKKFDIEEFDPTNQVYDPNFQESLVEIPTPAGCKQGNVAMTMRTGYLIKGRLLRSARVGIFN